MAQSASLELIRASCTTAVRFKWPCLRRLSGSSFLPAPIPPQAMAFHPFALPSSLGTEGQRIAMEILGTRGTSEQQQQDRAENDSPWSSKWQGWEEVAQELECTGSSTPTRRLKPLRPSKGNCPLGLPCFVLDSLGPPSGLLAALCHSVTRSPGPLWYLTTDSCQSTVIPVPHQQVTPDKSSSVLKEKHGGCTVAVRDPESRMHSRSYRTPLGLHSASTLLKRKHK